jgi:hypothetical protein
VTRACMIARMLGEEKSLTIERRADGPPLCCLLVAQNPATGLITGCSFVVVVVAALARLVRAPRPISSRELGRLGPRA